MSSIIHMDLEEVTRIITRIRQIQQTINDRVNNAAVQASNMDWIGSDRDHFVDNFQSWKQTTLSGLSDLQYMADRLSTEQNQWIQADSDGGNRLKVSIGDVSVGSALSGVWGWLKRHAEQKKQQYTIDEAWEQMMSTESGKELIELAKKHGIKFVLPSGKIIGDGDYAVKISIKDLDGARGTSYGRSVVIDQDLMDRASRSPDSISGTLAHEIQHEIDKKMGLMPNDDVYTGIQRNLNNGDFDTAEKMLNEAMQKRAESEIRAHNRGYEVDRGMQLGEAFVNDDDVYSPGEVKFIVNIQGYENIYETQYNELFPGHRVDVWVDGTGQIQCDIKRLIEARDVYYA